MEEANSEYREALAQAGQLVVSYPLNRADLVQQTCSKSYRVRWGRCWDRMVKRT